MNMNKFNLCFNNKKNDVLIANFLKTGDNKQFFNNFIENPTEKNKNKLDIAFKNYYREIKIVYCKIKVQTCAKNLYRVLHYFCA